MPTRQYTSLLVGAWARPPAKQVLAVLPAGAQLTLQAEPENPYDANAVRVMVSPEVIPESQYTALDEALLTVGHTLEMLMSSGPLQLGYLPAQAGKPLAKARQQEPGLAGNQDVFEAVLAGKAFATLAFGLDGTPRVNITVDSDE